MKSELFQACGHCWVFQICWHIECSTFTASSFRIWNSSTGIPSLPVALFVVILSKAHLTLPSKMSDSRLVITSSWLSGSWRTFLYSSSLKVTEILSEGGGKTGALIELWWDPRCYSRVEIAMWGNFRSCLKCVKDPFEAQEGRWDFTWDTAAEKGLILHWRENLQVFLEFGSKLGVPLELWQGPQGPTLGASGKSSRHASCQGPLRIS